MKKRQINIKTQLKQFYPVEAIQDKRYNTKTKSFQYLVKWKDWADEFNTWEPQRNVIGCQLFIQQFQAQKYQQKQIISEQGSKQEILQQEQQVNMQQEQHDDSYVEGIRKFITKLKQQIDMRNNQHDISKDSLFNNLQNQHNKKQGNIEDQNNQNIKTAQQLANKPIKNKRGRKRKNQLNQNQQNPRKKIKKIKQRKGAEKDQRKSLRRRLNNIQKVSNQLKTQGTQTALTKQKQLIIDALQRVKERKRLKQLQKLQKSKKVDYQSVRNGNVIIQEIQKIDQNIWYIVRDSNKLNIPLLMTSKQLIEINRQVLLQYYKKSFVRSSKNY